MFDSTPREAQQANRSIWCSAIRNADDWDYADWNKCALGIACGLGLVTKRPVVAEQIEAQIERVFGISPLDAREILAGQFGYVTGDRIATLIEKAEYV